MQKNKNQVAKSKNQSVTRHGLEAHSGVTRNSSSKNHQLKSTITPEIRETLFMLRESFRATAEKSDVLVDWWRGLLMDNRRLLLAWSGNEDGEEFAARPWSQLPEETKKTVLQTGRKWARMFEPVRHVWWD